MGLDRVYLASDAFPQCKRQDEYTELSEPVGWAKRSVPGGVVLRNILLDVYF